MDKIGLFVLSATAISLVFSEPIFGDRYQHNPFLQKKPATVFPEVYSQPPQGTKAQPANTGCEDFWTYGNDHGLISIPDPHYEKIVVRLVLSIAAYLPSVSLNRTPNKSSKKL